MTFRSVELTHTAAPLRATLCPNPVRYDTGHCGWPSCKCEDNNPKDIIARLHDACNGHPAARVPWPHRLLHDAVAEIERLRAALDRGPCA